MRVLLVCVVALVIAAGAAASKTKPYLNVTPASPTDPSSFTLSGCGFVDGDVYVTVWHNPETGGYTGPGTIGYSQEEEADADGCVSFVFSMFGAGDYQVTAYQHHGPIAANYLVVTFTVT